MAKIKCLQVGNTNWASQYEIPEHVEWTYLENQVANSEIEKMIMSATKEKPIKKYNALLLTDASTLDEYQSLIEMMDYYTILYDKQQITNENLDRMLTKKLSHSVSLANPQQIISDIATFFYSGQYGLRIQPNRMAFANSYQGIVQRNGEHEISIAGDFGDEYSYLCSWREHNWALADLERKTELFLEYHTSGNIEIQLKVIEANQYSGQVHKVYTFDQQQLKQAVNYGPKLGSSHIHNYQLYVKGKGQLRIGSLHLRFARGKYGAFILGGERFADEKGHELISYFEPGDFKPPLCVYFGGFRSAEGFEGYYMMKNMKTPFMLFEDLGLVGGAFYRGTPEFQQRIISKIQEKLAYLGFTNDQLVLSGMSMGTHASLYYAVDLQPHGIVINKPLVNLNTVAENQIIKAPQIFPYVLDLQTYLKAHQNLDDIHQIDQEFWQHFRLGDLSKTDFFIAHMLNDDYDDRIFKQLREWLIQYQNVVMNKGIPGRHNDNGSISNPTFLYYYHLLLERDFNRKE